MIKKFWSVILNEAVPTCPMCGGQRVNLYRSISFWWEIKEMQCRTCGHAEKIGKKTVPWRWLGVRNG